MANIETVDALVHDMCGAPDAVPAEPPRARSGEHRLARTLIQDAMKDAAGAPGAVRDDARAWLRNASALLSSKYCFEALDIDYSAALRRLEEKWRAQP
jgi:hypothetical protein